MLTVGVPLIDTVPLDTVTAGVPLMVTLGVLVTLTLAVPLIVTLPPETCTAFVQSAMSLGIQTPIGAVIVTGWSGAVDCCTVSR